MPALFLVLGIAVVVFIAAAGHHPHPTHARSQTLPPPEAVFVELDRGMPPSVVDQVLTALGGESDPARLDALGASLGAYYPLSASELHAKAGTLRASRAASSPAALSTATPAALPAAAPEEARRPPEDARPSPTGAPALPLRELDAAAVLQAAMRALVEETDPVVLDGFAESIRAPYPAAAEILSARAQTLRASASGAADGTPAVGTTPTPATPSPFPTPPEVPS